ncbi:hypothetical protein BDV93DRAFT_557939 [Ceratobasidium sp. AG-I]|nr:hypothetical protein BDV93DRAFT_557939 [Ceratobasidium sp. AG-I]
MRLPPGRIGAIFHGYLDRMPLFQHYSIAIPTNDIRPAHTGSVWCDVSSSTMQDAHRVSTFQAQPQMSLHGRRLPSARIREIFPPGFDAQFGLDPSSSGYMSHRGHFSSPPGQLYYLLVERYDPATHMESIIVKSVWYGKMTKSVEHEFLVIQVEDIDVPGLINYLILDRNAEPSMRPQRDFLFRTIAVLDTFAISYDGSLEKLLQVCQLKPYIYLEELLFPSDSRLHLYELVTLARVVSNRYPDYRLLRASYMFAGLIWECMHLMRPFAGYRVMSAGKRGKGLWTRYTPSESNRQEIYEAVQSKLSMIEIKPRGDIKELALESVNEESEEPE